MAKIYTTKGDSGFTSLLGGEQAPKSDPRIEAYGTVDELSSLLGLAVAVDVDPHIRRQLPKIQRQLFVIGAILAEPKMSPKSVELLPDDVYLLEQWIDELDNYLPTLTQFLIPGGTVAASVLHVARSVCRRAERRVCSLQAADYAQGKLVVQYLNRLGDYLFQAARYVNQSATNSEHQP